VHLRAAAERSVCPLDRLEDARPPEEVGDDEREGDTGDEG
jgi:hypothetical protein